MQYGHLSTLGVDIAATVYGFREMQLLSIGKQEVTSSASSHTGCYVEESGGDSIIYGG